VQRAGRAIDTTQLALALAAAGAPTVIASQRVDGTAAADRLLARNGQAENFNAGVQLATDAYRVPKTSINAGSSRTRWSWPEWTSIAASLLIGVLAGRTLLDRPHSVSGLIASGVDGRIIASGPLAQALSEQLSSEDNKDIDIGLSFRAKNGEYCRTFGANSSNLVVGFACRDAEVWRIDMLATPPRTESRGDYRMASTQLPAPIVQAIAARMRGEALDADEEAVARRRRWRD
jgi:hypothetical protein